MSNYWDMRFVLSAPPTARDAALRLLAEHSITEYEERAALGSLLFVSVPNHPAPVLPRWYEALPKAPAQTRIRVIRPTTIYKDRERREIKWESNVGDTMYYWGAHQDGWLLVFTDSYEHPTVQLWGWWEDFVVA